jgi:ribosomal protein S18 acetylase RimI-like enzyme
VIKRTESVQIIFRETKEADLNSVLRMERNPENRPFIRQWTREQHRDAIIDDNMAHLVIQTTSNKMVGYMILIGIENPDRSIRLQRIVVDRKGEGNGRSAIKLLKKMVFEKYKAHRLWLEVVQHNDRAYSLYKSEGFVDEGVHRESLKQGEKFVNIKVMSILEHEYYREVNQNI